jgi:hypothetical protein
MRVLRHASVPRRPLTRSDCRPPRSRPLDRGRHTCVHTLAVVLDPCVAVPGCELSRRARHRRIRCWRRWRSGGGGRARQQLWPACCSRPHTCPGMLENPRLPPAAAGPAPARHAVLPGVQLGCRAAAVRGLRRLPPRLLPWHARTPARPGTPRVGPEPHPPAGAAGQPATHPLCPAWPWTPHPRGAACSGPTARQPTPATSAATRSCTRHAWTSCGSGSRSRSCR